eukprot:GHVT01029857.1.p1 GENE.GHVT01029857.1~~GHVT01029857.1.p1  ORF type:complete len:472 (+),score=66.95 GHVT01029857.1:527-1942(+)
MALDGENAVWTLRVAPSCVRALLEVEGEAYEVVVTHPAMPLLGVPQTSKLSDNTYLFGSVVGDEKIAVEGIADCAHGRDSVDISSVQWAGELLKLSFDQKLDNLVGRKKELVVGRLRSCTSLSDVFYELQLVIRKLHDSARRRLPAAAATAVPENLAGGHGDDGGLPPALVAAAAGELREAAKTAQILGCDETLNHIDFQCTDLAGRTHLVAIDLTYIQSAGMTLIRRSVSMEYPVTLPPLPPVRDRLGVCQALQQVEVAFEALQDYFRVLEHIDAHCRVIKPSQPNLKEPARRIAVTSQLEVEFRINPDAPRAPPMAVRFLGPSEAAEKMARQWRVAIDKVDAVVSKRRDEDGEGTSCWDFEQMPPRNICTILALEELPKPWKVEPLKAVRILEIYSEHPISSAYLARHVNTTLLAGFYCVVFFARTAGRRRSLLPPTEFRPETPLGLLNLHLEVLLLLLMDLLDLRLPH